MTSLENPSIGQFLVYKLGKALAKKERARDATRTHTWVQTTIRLILQLAGFACLTYAGFVWHIVAGLVVAGISCFVLSWLTTTNEEAPKPDPLLAGRR